MERKGLAVVYGKMSLSGLDFKADLMCCSSRYHYAEAGWLGGLMRRDTNYILGNRCTVTMKFGMLLLGYSFQSILRPVGDFERAANPEGSDFVIAC